MSLKCEDKQLINLEQTIVSSILSDKELTFPPTFSIYGEHITPAFRQSIYFVMSQVASKLRIGNRNKKIP